VNQAVTGRTGRGERATQGKGAGHAGSKPATIDGLRRAVLQDAHPYGRNGIVEADREEAAVTVENDGQIARAALAGERCDCLVEHPGMALPEGALGRRRHAYGEPFLTGSWQLQQVNRHSGANSSSRVV